MPCGYHITKNSSQARSLLLTPAEATACLRRLRLLDNLARAPLFFLLLVPDRHDVLPLDDAYDPCVNHVAHENENGCQCGGDGAGPAGEG